MYRNHRVAKETHPNWREPSTEPLPVRIIDKNLEATEYIYLTVAASKPAAIKTEVSIIFTRYKFFIEDEREKRAHLNFLNCCRNLFFITKNWE